MDPVTLSVTNPRDYPVDRGGETFPAHSNNVQVTIDNPWRFREIYYCRDFSVTIVSGIIPPPPSYPRFDSVRSVNGTGPDEGGDVAVEIPPEYARISGDPEDGQHFAWDEESGMLVPVPAPGGGSGPGPAYANQGSGAVFAAFGNGDPQRAADLIQFATLHTNTLLDGSAINTSRAFAVKFRLPQNLNVTALRGFPYGTTTGVFRFSIYRASDLARLLDTGFVNTTANTWQTYAVSATALAKDTDYWLAVTVSSGNTTFAWRTMPLQSQTANFWGAAAAPLGGLSIGMAEFGVLGGVAGGVPPATATGPTPMPVAATVPFIWLTGTAS